MKQPSISARAVWVCLRHRIVPGLAAAVLLAALSVTLPAAATGQAPSSEPHPPPYYAITNARIVTVSGPVIESGTVVIANGLITAVGTNVDIPPEAWVIDGEGLTVYPGLIDALSDLGLAQPQQAAGAGRGAAAAGGQRAPAAQGPEDRPATFSGRMAANDLVADDSRIATWRAGGYTAVMTVPSDGLVTGQGAVVSLRDGRPEEMVVKSPAALRLGFRATGGFRSYPGSLFAVIAYHRQLFLDAQRYTLATHADQARAAGLDRPAYDETLEPLIQFTGQRWPVLIPGNEAREINRALKLGAELGLNTVVYGAQQGYAVAATLAEAGTPVLVNLDWPERTRDADPDTPEALSSLRNRTWSARPSTPACRAKRRSGR
jgi:imidazolonepropionase-like amidohydrolase